MTNRRPLGDAAPLVRRLVDPEPNTHYTEIGVRSYGRGLFLKHPVTGSEIGVKRVFSVTAGDLVISNVFAWEGAIAVADAAHTGKIGSHRFMTMIPAADMSAKWLQQYLLTEQGLSQVRAASPGSAGRNRTLSLSGLSQLSVPAPPLRQQLQVAEALHAAELMLDTLRLRFAETGPRELAATLPRLLGERLSALPVPRVPCGELFEVVNDLVHPGDDPGRADSFVGLQHIEPHTGRLLGSGPLGEETGRKFRFAPGDVLYGYLRPYLNKVWVADRHGLCSVEQFVLRPVRGVNVEDLADCLRSSLVLDAAVDATNNLQLPRLRIAKLQSISVPDIRAMGDGPHATASIHERVRRLADARNEQADLLTQVLPRLREEVFSPYLNG